MLIEASEIIERIGGDDGARTRDLRLIRIMIRHMSSRGMVYEAIQRRSERSKRCATFTGVAVIAHGVIAITVSNPITAM